MENREQLGSRIGFILLSAGCAIGCGNVWKFPWMVGQYGGGAFVLVYLVFLLILGVPVMTMEFAIGRAAQKSPARMYQQLEPAGTKWHVHGYASLIGNIVLMMFYTVVAGWMLNYFLKTVTGTFEGLDPAGVGGVFGTMLSNPWENILFMGIIVLLAAIVESFSLKAGLESISKYMMLVLFALMVALVVHSFTLPGAREGLAFYLVPHFEKITPEVAARAMNQACFTLSLGIGAMAIFGSYIGKDRALMGESVHVIALDTLVAIMAGLIIFPACFTYGVQPDSGPSLIFVTLPNVFNHMSFGMLWGSLFFLFMTFAAFSTILAVFEVILACLKEMTGWSRRKAALITGVGLFVLSIPCALGFNVWAGFEPLGPGKGILDLEDYVVEYLLLPLGSLVYVFFVTSRYGWGWDRFVKEANTGKGLKVRPWMRGYVKFVLPVIILVVFVIGQIFFFLG